MSYNIKLLLKNKLPKFIEPHKELFFLVLSLGLYLFFGITTLSKYGIHVDDFSLANYGQLVSYNLVDPLNEDYMGSFMRYYGPTFEVFSHLLISYFGIPPTTLTYFLVRKLIIFITYLSAIGFFYFLLRKYFTMKVSVLGTVNLFLIPSLFGYGSITSKEIPLLSFSIISIFFIVNYFETKEIKNLIFHSISFGLALAIRPTALTLLPISLLFIVLSDLNIKKLSLSFLLKKMVLVVLMFIVTLIPLLILDPFLHTNPILHFLSRIEFMSNFDMGGFILVKGNVMKISESNTLDMFILGVRKLPEIFILLTLIGALGPTYRFIKTKDKRLLLFIITLLWFFLPFLTVLIKGTKFYNFRHLLIFLPPLGILSTFGIDFLINRRAIFISKLALFLILIGLFISLINIYKLFPYEITYFNRISGGLPLNSKLYTNYPEGLAEGEAISKLCSKEKEPFKLSGPFVDLYIPYYCPNKAIYTENYVDSNFIITYDFYEKLTPIPEKANLIDKIEREDTSILNIYSIIKD